MRYRMAQTGIFLELYQYLGSFWSKFGYLTSNLTSVTLETRSKTFFLILLIEFVHIMGGLSNNLMPKV